MCQNALESRNIRFDKNGKFKHKHRITKDTPWVLNKKLATHPTIDGCTEYHWFFSGKDARLGFIHSFCHDCYKVVVRPKTVKQLFQLCDLQEKMDYPSKCGIELRPYVPALYGGYFYNRSLEDGKECLKTIKKEVRSKIDPTIKIILKRGCTEFEQRFGPSDKWMVELDQLKFEKEFLNVYVKDIGPKIEMPLYLKSHVKTKWLHWAAQNNDKTYKEFTNGVSLIGEPDYVEYDSSSEVKD